MRQAEFPSWEEFWKESGTAFLKASGKSLALFPVAVFFAVLVSLVFECIGGPDQRSEIACAVARAPMRIFLDIAGELHWILPIMTIPLPGILYLEWCKYKEDKPSGFIYLKVRNEVTWWVARRRKQLMADSLILGGHSFDAVEVKDRFRRFTGPFSEPALQKYFTSFVGTWKKPIKEREGHQRWRILIRNGDEVHINVRRQSSEPLTWVMTVEFFNWNGRRQPAKLAETHVTEFVAIPNLSKDEEMA